MDGACCAAVGLANLSSGTSVDHLRWLLLHLDNAMISPCLRGTCCVQEAFTAVAHSLIEYSTAACRVLDFLPAGVIQSRTILNNRWNGSNEAEWILASQALLRWTEVRDIQYVRSCYPCVAAWPLHSHAMATERTNLNVTRSVCAGDGDGCSEEVVVPWLGRSVCG